MKNKLQKHFPMIRTKGEALEAIKNNKKLWGIFCSWKEEYCNLTEYMTKRTF